MVSSGRKSAKSAHGVRVNRMTYHFDENEIVRRRFIFDITAHEEVRFGIVFLLHRALLLLLLMRLTIFLLLHHEYKR